jgi:hypothetical protein
MDMNQPQLDRPGAGLPFPDNLIVRWWVGPFQSRQKDAATNLRLFKMAGARVLKEMAGVPADRRDRKVLVPKMRGVEDSSRHWCANEVLEHLMITGVPMRGLIVDLAQGRTSDYEVGTRAATRRPTSSASPTRRWRSWARSTSATRGPRTAIPGWANSTPCSGPGSWPVTPASTSTSSSPSRKAFNARGMLP